MKLPRVYQNLEEFIKPGKVLVIYGPRQVGKTTILKDFLASTPFRHKLDSGEDVLTQEVFSSQKISTILEYARGYDLIAIDEAQRIEEIGLGLKLLVDHLPAIRVIATGSSSFELSGQIGEPLTGRKQTLTLFPISQLERAMFRAPYELRQHLEEDLIYGGYPEVMATNDPSEKKRILNEITGSYLLKDILALERVKSSKILLDILRLLAFQIGGEVSLSEIATQVGIDSKTVARYLDLFEKTFIIHRLNGFSRNLRKEITKKSKYYFLDNGIRNTIIANFNPFAVRDDVGRLWENFIVIERLKKRSYRAIYANSYFWRTWDRKEIDLIEEMEGKLHGYEIKWTDKRAKAPAEWLATYPNADHRVIHRDNYGDFIA